MLRLPTFTSIWPWEWGQEIARYGIDATIAAAVGLIVGFFIAIVGLLFIARKLPSPFGAAGGFVLGGILAVIGVLVALGVLF